MFRYRFSCDDKMSALYRMNSIKANDLPVGTSLFGADLYKSGIHFKQCGETVKGFFLDRSEDDSHRGGSQTRVCFFGKFVDDNDVLYFDVYIYPHVFQVLLLLVLLVSLSLTGKVIAYVISVVVLVIFTKSYVDMAKATLDILRGIFN